MATNRLKRLKAWLWRMTPVTRGRMIRELEAVATRNRTREEYWRAKQIDELKDSQKQVEAIVRRATDINFERDRDSGYNVTVTFDHRLMSGMHPSDSLRLLAEWVGRMVEAEISSCRFVESAKRRSRGIRD